MMGDLKKAVSSANPLSLKKAEPTTLSDDELNIVTGGRIPNIRANASGLGGGGLIGTTQLLG